MQKNNYNLLSTYDYYLPENQIAQTPIEPRDHSKLLAYNIETKQIEHKHFYNIIDFLKSGDVLVINNTRVIPARLYGVKVSTGAKIEILLLKRINLTTWETLVKPGKRAKIGEIIKFNSQLSCKIVSNTDFGGKIVEFIFNGVFEEIIADIGFMPLPPYIHKTLEDKERYQTVYSKTNGSSAAPTAGLHFTPELIEKIKQKGVKIVEVLLHVGLGTFRPVEEDDITNHKMHSEYYSLSQEVADIINNAKKNGERIISVGTTSVRVLESCANKNGELVAGCGETQIFIYPPYKFKVVDCLITNFHLPKSTLLMLVSALAGREEVLNVYKNAVENGYRFFSFGDSSFFYLNK